MSTQQDEVAEAARIHEELLSKLAGMRATKVDVYFLLRRVHDGHLFRHIDLPMAPAHRRRLLAKSVPGTNPICTTNPEGTKRDTKEESVPSVVFAPQTLTDEAAGGNSAPPLLRPGSSHGSGWSRAICAENRRKFTTWEDYLDCLGDSGISFAYFAELQRLERRFGVGFVRICARGIPVRTRRLLLKAPNGVRSQIYAIAISNTSDDDKLESIDALAQIWRIQYEAKRSGSSESKARVCDYRRHATGWAYKFRAILDDLGGYDFMQRGTPFGQELVAAWREVFEVHLEIGSQLAEMRLTRDLGPTHRQFINTIQSAWGASSWSDADTLPALPPPEDRPPGAAPILRPRPKSRPIAGFARAGRPRIFGLP
jgi:hypothetical protein